MPFTGVSITGATIADNVAVATTAEQSGNTTGWAAEVSGLDAVTVMAASACATTSLQLNTGIISNFVRSPYLSAMTFISLADLSGGRVAAGFGTSTPAIVEGWHGLPFQKPVAATREYVDLFRRFVAGERVKSAGIYSIRGASLRASAYPIPVYLAALNERMLELAGEIADGVILNFVTLSYTERALQAIDRGLAKANRSRTDIHIVANFRTGAGPFDDIATMLRRELITYFLAPVYQKVFTADGWGEAVTTVAKLWADGDRAGAIAAIPDDFVAAHNIAGAGTADCLAKLQPYHDLGVQQAVLFPVVADGANARERRLDLIRAFGTK
jgi:probable F420-dependent oxidoreductase